jgi:hypothetical protein
MPTPSSREIELVGMSPNLNGSSNYAPDHHPSDQVLARFGNALAEPSSAEQREVEHVLGGSEAADLNENRHASLVEHSA